MNKQHGGARAGAGRKKRPFVCAADGCSETTQRIGKPRSQYCSDACASRNCLGRPGPRGGVKHTQRDCRVCGRTFTPRYPKQIACSRGCGKEWLVATYSNPEKTVAARRLSRRRHCARRRRLGARVESGRWRRICERDGWKCWICHRDIDPSLTAPHRFSGTADHVIALANGGADDDGNLRAAHFSCNCRRGAGKFIPKEKVA